MKKVLTCLLSLSMLAGPALAQPADLASAVTAALERAEGSAPAAQVLRDAGVEPGSLTREQVIEAFTPALGAERVAALAESFDREPMGPDAAVELLTLRAAEGERVAGVFLLAPAAAALLAALAGCAGTGAGSPGAGSPGHTNMCTGRGYIDVPQVGMRIRALAVARAYALEDCSLKGCGNCEVTDVVYGSDQGGFTVTAFAVGSRP